MQQVKTKLIENYSKKEKDNYKNGKIKIVQQINDIDLFVNNAKKSTNNMKLYFGKVGKELANKIKDKTGINIEKYNISLKNDAIRHILKRHSSYNEKIRGQIEIINSDFYLITDIISAFDDVVLSGLNKSGKPVLTFKKVYNEFYYLVNYISDKNHNLEVQTMYKKQKKSSSTANNE